jgi:hypothetical protein
MAVVRAKEQHQPTNQVTPRPRQKLRRTSQPVSSLSRRHTAPLVRSSCNATRSTSW